MPHSLRARLSWLRYKRIITDKDYSRLCKALDNVNVIDNIRVEIESKALNSTKYVACGLYDAIEIIDKYNV